MALHLITEDHEAVRALKLIDSFFEKFNPEKCDEEIWELITTYFSVPDGQLPMARHRASTIYFCQQVLFLLKGLANVREMNVEQKTNSNRA